MLLRWIIGQALRFRFFVLACAAGLMVFGVGALRNMPIDVFPEFAPPRVEIHTVCVGLSASEVVDTTASRPVARRNWTTLAHWSQSRQRRRASLLLEEKTLQAARRGEHRDSP